MAINSTRRPWSVGATACLCLTLAGCAAIPGVGQRDRGDEAARAVEIDTLLNQMPRDVASAVDVGVLLSSAYAQRGKSVKMRRTALNLGLLTASTYVTAASALGAHADSIFAGALTGQTLTQLDPIVIPGGTETWVTAMAKTQCAVRAGSQAAQYQAVADSLRPLGDGEADEALSAYDQLGTGLMMHYQTAYGGYITATTGALFDDDRFQTLVQKLQTPEEALAAADAAKAARDGALVDRDTLPEAALASLSDLLNRLEEGDADAEALREQIRAFRVDDTVVPVPALSAEQRAQVDALKTATQAARSALTACAL